MLYIKNENCDPYFNLAFEEYVFNTYDSDDILLVWRNSPCVVIGKYQNAYYETSFVKAEEQHLPILRRETGGGAVYHDLGNINYAIITNSADIGVCYEDYLTPVVAALNSMEIPAYKDKICDIALCGKKISGSAARSTRTRTLHHGTLLYSADMDKLHESLVRPHGIFESKAVESNPSCVTNIAEHYNMNGTAYEFMTRFAEQMSYDITASLSDKELSLIEELARDKYQTWEWTFGKSPAFTYENEAVRDNMQVRLKFSVKRGIIDKLCDFSSNCIDENAARNALVGTRLCVELLREACNVATESELCAEMLFEACT